MEGRTPRGIYVLVEDRVDASAAGELARWYVEERIPSATRGGVFGHVTRFVHEGAQGGAREPGYITVFETDAADPARAWSELDLGPDHPALRVLMQGGFVATGALPPPPAGRPTRGLLVGLTDCPDPDGREEFDRWYDEVHAADVLRYGRHHAARRYERTGGDMPGFLAFYETEGEEPTTFQGYLGWPERDTTPTDACAVRHVWTFNLLQSEASS